MKILMSLGLLMGLVGCRTVRFEKTVESVEIQRFMGRWYVRAGRFTFLEKGAHNAVEIYSWNAEKSQIDIDFSFRKDGFDGELKKIPQKAWIYNSQTNAHWKVQPFWPLKFDYLVIGLAKDYEWTAMGVPDGKYLWVMGRSPDVSDADLQRILKDIESMGYPTQDIIRVPQKWN